MIMLNRAAFKLAPNKQLKNVRRLSWPGIEFAWRFQGEPGASVKKHLPCESFALVPRTDVRITI